MAASGSTQKGNGRATAPWSADGLRRCNAETLAVIAALLLEPCDLMSLLPADALHEDAVRTEALARLVALVHDDGVFATCLAQRLTARVAPVAHLLERSPFEILRLWGARSASLSRHELGAMLGRLACAGDAALEPLARRLCRDVQLEALRALPDALGAASMAAACGGRRVTGRPLAMRTAAARNQSGGTG